MGNSGEMSASVWLDQHMQDILTYSTMAAAVAFQGVRIEESTALLKPGEPKDIALDQLHRELEEDYAAMLHAQQMLPPRDELQQQVDTVHAELAGLAQEASAMRLVTAAEIRQMEDEVEEAAAQVPAAEARLLEYIQERIEHLMTERAWNGLEHEYDATELAKLYAGAVAMADFVPVPDALSSEQRTAIADRVRAGARLVERAPEPPVDIHALAAAVREAHPDIGSQTLNTFAALIFLQDPSRKFTRSELVSILYEGQPSDIAENKLAALLSHSLEGREGGVARLLAKHHYKLVKEREVVGVQPDQEGARSTIIYRIVPLDA